MKNLIITSVFILSSLFAQVDYEADIQPIWDNNCTSCHVYGHSSGLNLNTSGVSYNNLVDVVSQNYAPALRVATGDPGAVLYAGIGRADGFVKVKISRDLGKLCLNDFEEFLNILPKEPEKICLVFFFS